MAWGNYQSEFPPTLEFRVNRPRALARDHHECQVRESGCLHLASEVDHIINRAEGGTDELENLQSICTSCHKKKTARESLRGRRRRRDAARHPDSRMKHPGLR